jgi:hypothetical protein
MTDVNALMLILLVNVCIKNEHINNAKKEKKMEYLQTSNLYTGNAKCVALLWYELEILMVVKMFMWVFRVVTPCGLVPLCFSWSSFDWECLAHPPYNQDLALLDVPSLNNTENVL